MKRPEQNLFERLAQRGEAYTRAHKELDPADPDREEKAVLAALEEPPAAKAPVKKLTVEIPDYLYRAIRSAAVEEGTIRYVILKALQKDGFEIKDVDFYTDGRAGSSSDETES